MISVSNAFLTALHAGAPQRWAFVWDADNTILTNEDISVEEGVSYDETFCSETDLTIGLTPSSHMSFTMLNADYQWLNFPFGRFTAKLGVRISVTENGSARTRRPTIVINGNTMTASGNGVLETYELAPFGIFYAKRPDILRRTQIAVDAYDAMTLFDCNMPSFATLGISDSSLPVSAGTLLDAMCSYLNVTTVTDLSSTFLNHGVTLAKEPENFSTSSMRDVLAYIAELGCAIARFNREGKLNLVWLNPINVSYNEHGYVAFDRTEYATTPVNKLSVRNEDQTQETVVGTGTTSPYMIQDNPFLNQA